MQIGHSVYLDVALNLTAWQRRAASRCETRSEAKQRLEKALDLLGGEPGSKDEPGLSVHQSTLEELLKSVITFLA